MVPDLDKEGKPQSFRVNWVDVAAEEDRCKFFSGGLRLTPCQFLFIIGYLQAPINNLLLIAIYGFIYSIELPFFEQYKIDKVRPWPWKEDPEGWVVLQKKAAKSLSFNLGVVNFFTTGALCWTYGFNLPYNINPDQMPDPLTLMKHVFVMMFMEDMTFYFVHRTLHFQHPKLNLYKMIHKTHHEFMQPVGFVSYYQHPLEFMLVQQCFLSGLYVLGSNIHFYSALVYNLIRLIETYDGHSGYEFPWMVFRLLPFGSDATYHNFHHTRNAGNYAAFMTVWDTVFDSNQEYYLNEIKSEKSKG